MNARQFSVKLAALVLAPFAVSIAAQAQPAAPGVCAFEATLDVQSVHIVIGSTQGVGTGKITCQYADGSTEVLPVRVTTEGAGFGLGASQAEVKLVASGLGIEVGGARSFLGDYALTSAGAEIAQLGGDVSVGLTANRDGISLPIALSARNGEGLEVAANFGRMTIAPLR